jgi:hypothetical protein
MAGFILVGTFFVVLFGYACLFSTYLCWLPHCGEPIVLIQSQIQSPHHRITASPHHSITALEAREAPQTTPSMTKIAAFLREFSEKEALNSGLPRGAAPEYAHPKGQCIVTIK